VSGFLYVFYRGNLDLKTACMPAEMWVPRDSNPAAGESIRQLFDRVRFTV